MKPWHVFIITDTYICICIYTNIYMYVYKYAKVISICSLALLNGIIMPFVNVLGRKPKCLSQVNSS